MSGIHALANGRWPGSVFLLRRKWRDIPEDSPMPNTWLAASYRCGLNRPLSPSGEFDFCRGTAY
jgi:hypothetical protein